MLSELYFYCRSVAHSNVKVAALDDYDPKTGRLFMEIFTRIKLADDF